MDLLVGYKEKCFNPNEPSLLLLAKVKNILRLKPNNNKLERFNVIVPDFKLKRFFFPIEKKLSPVLKELMLELSQATFGGFRSKHDDGLDTISQLGMMTIWTPSQEIPTRQVDSIWEMPYQETNNQISSYIV